VVGGAHPYIPGVNAARVLLACLVLGPPAAAAEPLLLTIDDLPLVSSQYFTRAEQARQFRAILDAIEKHGARGVFFANAERIRASDPPLLDELVRRGHLVGNHTYSHPSLNDVSPAEYQADIARNDRELARWLKAPKYFRFTFLQTGITRPVRDGVARFLASQAYVAVPVTIDTDDWDYNLDYTRAVKRGASDAASAIATRYLEAVARSAATARSEARRKLGRDVAHVLLLHMNLLNADVLERLLASLAADGFSFAGPSEVLSDPLYALEDDYFGPQGLTWLDRVLR
jgi:peptidoglycan/xylan/chitin deacetylase (PgdA/CDA1 family)